MTKRCAECGRPVECEIPDGLSDALRELVEGWEALCTSCDERAQAETAQRVAEREHASRVRALRHRVRVSGVPKRLQLAALADLDGDQPAEDARRWAAREIDGLLLSGPVGAGKTYTAAAAAMAALAYRPVIWCSAPALLAQLSTDRRDLRHEQAVDALTGSTALVLDDLDKVRPTPYGAEQILGAIDARTAAGHPLLVTTNLELAEIASHWPQPWGESVASRLAGHCVWHRLTQTDRRTVIA